MGMITVGIGLVSALSSRLEACALLASKAVWLVDIRTEGATIEWK